MAEGGTEKEMAENEPSAVVVEEEVHVENTLDSSEVDGKKNTNVVNKIVLSC